jgi:hypothetical protein
VKNDSVPYITPIDKINLNGSRDFVAWLERRKIKRSDGFAIGIKSWVTIDRDLGGNVAVEKGKHLAFFGFEWEHDRRVS